MQSPFFRAMGGPYRGKLVGLGETVLAHLPLTDEHFVRTDDTVVYARNVTTTRRAQLVRREPQVSHRDPTEAKVDDNR